MATVPTYTQILNRFRDQLIEKEIRPIALAEMSARDISHVSRWLNGKVIMSIPTLLHLCDSTDIDPAVLFTQPDSKKKRS